jgi:hypothetical protein
MARQFATASIPTERVYHFLAFESMCRDLVKKHSKYHHFLLLSLNTTEAKIYKFLSLNTTEAKIYKSLSLYTTEAKIYKSEVTGDLMDSPHPPHPGQPPGG